MKSRIINISYTKNLILSFGKLQVLMCQYIYCDTEFDL